MSGPNALVESLEAAMEMIHAVVGGERVLGAVQRELARADAVAIPANKRAEVGAVAHVAGEIVVAKRDIHQLAILVGYLEGLEDAAIGHDLGDGALLVLERVKFDRFAIHRAKRGF